MAATKAAKQEHGGGVEEARVSEQRPRAHRRPKSSSSPCRRRCRWRPTPWGRTSARSSSWTAGAQPGVESMRAGLLQAGPLAIAGVVANGASVILTVALARLLYPHSYGVLNQLTGLYLILSMPGSAVVVAVVRRVTLWHEDGSGHLVRRWAGRVHRQGTMLVLLWALIVFLGRHAVAVLLNQQSGVGIAAILAAAAFFVLLSLDRGLLQAHRSYKPLAVNLLVEAACGWWPS